MTDAPISFLPLGAIIQSFKVNGINIVQGFEKQEQYVSHNKPFFGETIGRVANRISNAKINNLNGQSYPLVANNKINCLHGGTVGWGKRVWKGPNPVAARQIPGVEGLQGGESVEFSLVSEDGDEGFPGTVEVKIVYTTGTQQRDDGKEAIVLGMEYEAQLVGGADETAINMTNHSYFNLSGAPTIDGTTVTLSTNKHLPVDDTAIPRGPIAAFDFDTSKPFSVTSTEPKVDHCFINNDQPSSVSMDSRAGPLKTCLEAHHAGSGVHLQVLSTEPAYQFYTGDFTNVPEVEGQPARGTRSAFCCEPGRYVNAVNVDEWRGMTVLKKGQAFGARIVYKAWSD